jgi:GntR family transcriptional regulator
MTEPEEFAEGSTPLDRGSPTPLWAQLEAELRRRLDAGHFERRFPTDRELMEIYAVSRHTARHAIGQLGADGIVRRARGIGTSLDRRTMARSLGALYGIYQLVEETGASQHSTIVELAVVRDHDAAVQLGLAPDTELVFLHRVNFAGHEPMAVDRVWLPASVARPMLDFDFTHTTLYAGLDHVIGRRPNAGWERIAPSIPTAEDRQALGLADGEAVFTLTRLGTFDGDPVEWRTTQVRGDRFAVAGEWSVGQRAELRMQLLPGG